MTATTKTNLKAVAFIILALIVINIIGSQFFHRFDLTQDKRYTLSKTSLDIIKKADDPMVIDIYLDGQFPGEFKRLQTETQNLLEEFKAYNRNIVFRFSNPLDDSEDSDAKRALVYNLFKIKNTIHSKTEDNEIKSSIKNITDLNDAIVKSFTGNGMTPASITVEDKGKQSQEVIFPWAVATYRGKSVVIPLLKNQMGASTTEKIVHSVQYLEYSFANGFNTILKTNEIKVAVIKGNGEMQDQFMGDFIKQVRQNYHIGPFTLDSIAKKPNESLAYLKKYDLAIIAKPTEKFSDEEKEALDQFVMNGGKMLWLVEQVNIEMDSLYNDSGSTLAFPYDLNLNDMFFKYGVRINPVLVKDVMAAPSALARENAAVQHNTHRIHGFIRHWFIPQRNIRL
jgi:uncharacterized beta-barrel protein YwiB (DUF1934 family)